MKVFVYSRNDHLYRQSGVIIAYALVSCEEALGDYNRLIKVLSCCSKITIKARKPDAAAALSLMISNI
jgi:hypothetical protein